MEAGKLIIKTVLDTKDVDDGIQKLDKDSKLKNVLNKLTDKFSSMFSKIGKGLGKVGSSMMKFGASLLSTITKVVLTSGKIGLALGVALPVLTAIVLAMVAIGAALDKVFDKNSQVKTDLQYIIFAIKTALQPLIDGIANGLTKVVKIIITILQYIMALANIIAGRNLFEKATPKAFAKYMKEANKSTKKTAKSMKDLNKQLAGFDEMNILGKNTSASGGSGVGGGIGNIMPSFDITKDLAQIEEKIKKWWAKITYKIANTNLLEKFGKNSISQINKVFGYGFELGSKIGTFIREKVIDPINEKIKVTGFTIQDIFNIPLALGLKVGKWLREHFAKLINYFIDGINTAFAFLGIHIEHIDDGLEKTGTGIEENITDNILDAVNKSAELKDSFNKLPKTTTTTINVKADTTKARKSIADLIGDIGKAGIDGALGIKNYIKAMGIIKARKGAIINMPGKGVPISNVVGGEAGKEGVIPLTDSQQMALLGEAIGKYITINATLINQMNGRVISRELQKIQNENSFASNL